MPRRKTRQTRPHCPSQTGIVGLRHGWPRAGCRGHEILQWGNIAGETESVVGNGEGTGLAFWLFCLVCLSVLVWSGLLVFLCSGSRFLVFRCSGQVFWFSCVLVFFVSFALSFLLPRPDAPTQSCLPLVTHCSCQRLDGGQVQTSQVWKEPEPRGAALVQERSHSALQRTKR